MSKHPGNESDTRRVSRLALRILTLAVLLLPVVARAGTGVRDLDSPAIHVKAPGRVVLVAIAHAGWRLVAVGEHGVIAYSNDNGKTWKQVPVPVDVTLTAVAFANASNGWAVGNYGVILHTTDGGLTWRMQMDGLQANRLTLASAQAVASVSNPSPEDSLAQKRARFFAADGPDKPFLALLVKNSKNVTVFGAYRMVFNTTDSGKTWTDWNLHVQDRLSHNLYDAAYIGNKIYIAAEMGLVFRSKDDGATFTKLASPGDVTLLSIIPAGNGGIFVCGVAGYAFRRGDGGKTWKPVDFHTDSNLTAALVLASGTILVVTESGNLYISTNHAVTFSALPLVEPMALYDATQARNGNVVVVGNLGAMIIPKSDFQKNSGV